MRGSIDVKESELTGESILKDLLPSFPLHVSQLIKAVEVKDHIYVYPKWLSKSTGINFC